MEGALLTLPNPPRWDRGGLAAVGRADASGLQLQELLEVQIQEEEEEEHPPQV